MEHIEGMKAVVIRPAGAEASEEDEEDDALGLSKHERRTAAMQARIAAMEEAAIGDKDWFMRGEAQAGASWLLGFLYPHEFTLYDFKLVLLPDCLLPLGCLSLAFLHSDNCTLYSLQNRIVALCHTSYLDVLPPFCERSRHKPGSPALLSVVVCKWGGQVTDHSIQH